MKKRIALLMVLVFLVGMLSACGENSINTKMNTFNVEFDPNGGEVVSGELEQEVKKGKDAEPPVLEREGYEFEGWSGDYTNIKEDTTITAKWTALYVVTFDADGGQLNGDAKQTVKTADELKVPTVTKEGYEFEGWDGDTSKIDRDTTFKAKWKEKVLTAKEVYALIEPSVVEIMNYDQNKKATAVGSGFFIDDNGTIATNHHVIKGAYYLSVRTSDGKMVYADTVVGYSEKLDLAIIKVNLKNTKPVTIDKRAAVTGETVYTLGSSKGLTDTFSDGIVSNVSRTVDGKDCIQITAPISPGNSGGPLIDSYGHVLGVNSMVYTSGQNLNFAIKIKELDKLNTSKPIKVLEFGASYAPTAAPTPVPGNGNTAEFTEAEKTFLAKYKRFEKEPNNGWQTAELVGQREIVAGRVGVGDYDVYKITIPSDMTIEVGVTTCDLTDAQKGNILAGLFDSTFKVQTNLANNKTALGYSAQAKCQAGQYKVTAGTYYIMIFQNRNITEGNGVVYATTWVQAQ